MQGLLETIVATDPRINLYKVFERWGYFFGTDYTWTEEIDNETEYGDPLKFTWISADPKPLWADIVEEFWNIREKMDLHPAGAAGDFKFSARSVDHTRWALCDGRELDEVDQALLFRQIGHTYDNPLSPPPSGKFHLPNMTDYPAPNNPFANVFISMGVDTWDQY